MHRYYWMEKSEADFYASFYDMNEFIKTIKATADYVKTKHRSRKIMAISFDEWNVWYQKAQGQANWNKAPHILEDIYNLRDALVFAGMMNTLINNCDRVKIACLAQLVNVIAPIFTEEGGKVIKQTTYYPFELASRYGRGVALHSISECEKFESKYGPVDFVSSSIVHDSDKKQIAMFLVNYNDKEMDLELELRSFGKIIPIECTVMNDKDLNAQNTIEKPDQVTMREGEMPLVKNDIVSAKLPASSYSMMRFMYE